MGELAINPQDRGGWTGVLPGTNEVWHLRGEDTVALFIFSKSPNILYMSVILVNSQPSERSPGISFQANEPPIILRKSYSLILQKDEDGRIVVRSRDLQGVVTDGADMDEAIRNAIEAVDAIVEVRGLDKDYNLTIIQRPGV